MVLYGMLCGCLPFDDEHHRRLQRAEYMRNHPESSLDVADPDTMPVNVKTLYGYITSTPLQFPVKIDILAVDLLRGILNPDPIRRLTIQEIWRHPWVKGLDGHQ